MKQKNWYGRGGRNGHILTISMVAGLLFLLTMVATPQNLEKAYEKVKRNVIEPFLGMIFTATNAIYSTTEEIINFPLYKKQTAVFKTENDRLKASISYLEQQIFVNMSRKNLANNNSQILNDYDLMPVKIEYFINNGGKAYGKIFIDSIRTIPINTAVINQIGIIGRVIEVVEKNRVLMQFVTDKNFYIPVYLGGDLEEIQMASGDGGDFLNLSSEKNYSKNIKPGMLARSAPMSDFPIPDLYLGEIISINKSFKIKPLYKKMGSGMVYLILEKKPHSEGKKIKQTSHHNDYLQSSIGTPEKVQEAILPASMVAEKIKDLNATQTIDETEQNNTINESIAFKYNAKLRKIKPKNTSAETLDREEGEKNTPDE